MCVCGSQLLSTVTVAHTQTLRVCKIPIISYSVLMAKFGATLTKMKHFVCPTSPWTPVRITSLRSPFPTFSQLQFPFIFKVDYMTLSMIVVFNATHFSQSLKLSPVIHLALRRRLIFSDSKTDYVGLLRGNLHAFLVAPSREVVQR